MEGGTNTFSVEEWFYNTLNSTGFPVQNINGSQFKWFLKKMKTGSPTLPPYHELPSVAEIDNLDAKTAGNMLIQYLPRMLAVLTTLKDTRAQFTHDQHTVLYFDSPVSESLCASYIEAGGWKVARMHSNDGPSGKAFFMCGIMTGGVGFRLLEVLTKSKAIVKDTHKNDGETEDR
jgi:hypothetical protein